MSENIETTRSIRRNRHDAASVASDADAASANGADHDIVVAIVPSGTRSVELTDATFDAAIKFVARMLFTDHTALVCQVAYERQFVNNMNANALARAKRLTTALAANDEKAIAENQPWTAEQYVTAWTTYEPNVGGTRSTGMERLRKDAGWNVWVAMVAEHNAAVSSGAPSPVFKSVTALMVIPGRGQKARVEVINGVSTNIPAFTMDEYREGRINAVLNAKSERITERVQTEIDRLMAIAEAEKAKPDVSAVVADISPDGFI
jgi:hypothetical protein